MDSVSHHAHSKRLQQQFRTYNQYLSAPTQHHRRAHSRCGSTSTVSTMATKSELTASTAYEAKVYAEHAARDAWVPPPFYVEGFHSREAVKRMPYRRLGDTHIMISKVALGWCAPREVYVRAHALTPLLCDGRARGRAWPCHGPLP